MIKSHETILEIITNKKTTEQVKEELSTKYKINYTSRYVRQHIKDMVILGWIKLVVVSSDMRKKYYQKIM